MIQGFMKFSNVAHTKALEVLVVGLMILQIPHPVQSEVIFKEDVEHPLLELAKEDRTVKLEAFEEVVVDFPEPEIVVEETSVEIPEPVIFTETELTGVDLYNSYAEEIGHIYNIDPDLIKSIIWHESRYRPDTTTGVCVGLMQVSTDWHIPRAERLGVTNLYDPYGNILVSVDYLAELYSQYQDMDLVLMLYSDNHDTAFALYKQGQVSWYVDSVKERAASIKRGEI